jgi:hypothetical protein
MFERSLDPGFEMPAVGSGVAARVLKVRIDLDLPQRSITHQRCDHPRACPSSNGLVRPQRLLFA